MKMLLLYAKYAVMFWLVIGSNQGNVQLIQKLSQDNKLYEVSACTASCLQKHRVRRGLAEESADPYQQPVSSHENQQSLTVEQQFFQNCFDLCQNASNAINSTSQEEQLANFHSRSENLYLKLVCRTDRSLTFRIDLTDHTNDANDDDLIENAAVDMANITETTITDMSDIVYIIKINSAKDVKESFVYVSDESFFTFEQLQPNMVYNLTVMAMHANRTFSKIVQEQMYATLRRGYQPDAVTSIDIVKYFTDSSTPTSLTALMEWRPMADMNCFYDIVYFSTVNNDFEEPIEYRDPRKLYSLEINDIQFSGEYKVGVRGVNIYNLAESDFSWLTFQAPACLDYYNFNYSFCAPVEPTGLNISQEQFEWNTLSINITWDMPMRLPDYYTVRVLDLIDNGNISSYIVDKCENSFIIRKIVIYGESFNIILTAHSPGGNTSTIEWYTKKHYISVKNNTYHLLALAVPIFCMALLSLSFIWTRKAKLRRYKERCKYLEDLEKKRPSLQSGVGEVREQYLDQELSVLHTSSDMWPIPVETFYFNDEMEIAHNDVILYEILGEGAFGLVRRGKFDKRDVAVKMLRDEPTMEDVQAFRHEIDFMKSVGKHPNIVGLVGHCTKQLNSMMLLIEFCSLGNLLDFLRDEWKFRQERKVRFAVQVNDESVQVQLKQTSKHALQIAFEQQQSRIDDLRDESDADSLLSAPISTPVTASTRSSCDSPPLFTIIETYTLTKPPSPPPPPPLPALPKLVRAAAENKSYGLTDTCKYPEVIQNIDGDSSLNEFVRLNAILEAKNDASKLETTTSETLAVQQKLGESYNKPQRLSTANNESCARTLTTVENREYFCGTKHAEVAEKPAADAIVERRVLQEADLIEIACQVAVGMEFLAKNKIVHRDLAARNVLVTGNRIMKIADFGLSRDVYHENVYKKTGSGKLPVKWMALESLTHQVYTTKSDVWSFGILLFEIMTLGSMPYPTVTSDRLVQMLRNGYRMVKPDECSDSIYKVMSACWNSAPAERPCFGQLIQELNKLLDKGSNDMVDYVSSIKPTTLVTTQAEIQRQDVLTASYLHPLP